MYRFLFTGFMIAKISSVFYIPKERTPQQNCRNIITQYMESLMMLQQEYPSSVLHHACFPAPSALLIIDFLRKLAPDGAQTYSESRSYARRIYGNSG